jgi:hypothetical protein
MDEPDEGRRDSDEADAGTVTVAVEAFLDDVDAVVGEYEQGYMDADAALERVERAVDGLRARVDGDDADPGAGDR